MPFYSTEPGPPQFPSGIAAAIHHAKSAPSLNITLAMAVEEACGPSDFSFAARGWLKVKGEYFRLKYLDREDIAEIESVLAGPASLAARLLTASILSGLKSRHKSCGGTGGLKFASV